MGLLWLERRKLSETEPQAAAAAPEMGTDHV